MANKGAFGVVKINTGTLVLVAELRSWRAQSEATEIDVTVMGTAGKAAMIPGAVRDGLELDLFFDFADAAQAFILSTLGADTSVAAEVYPLGEGTGKPFWSANVYIMGATPEATADGAVEMTGVTLSTDSAGATWDASP